MQLENINVETTSGNGLDGAEPENLEHTAVTMSDAVPDDLELSSDPAIDPVDEKSAIRSTDMDMDMDTDTDTDTDSDAKAIQIEGLPIVEASDEEKDDDITLEHDEVGLNPIEDADAFEEISRGQNTNCCEAGVQSCLLHSSVPEDVVEKLLCRADRALCTCEVTDWMEQTTGYALCGDKENVLDLVNDDDETKSMDETLTVVEESLVSNDDAMSTVTDISPVTPNQTRNSLIDEHVSPIESDDTSTASTASANKSKKKKFFRWKLKKNRNGEKNTDRGIEPVVGNEEQTQEDGNGSKCDVVPAVLPPVVTSANSTTSEREKMESNKLPTTNDDESVEEEEEESPGGVALTKIPSEIQGIDREIPCSGDMASEPGFENADHQDDQPEHEPSKLQKMRSFDSLWSKHSDAEEEEESGFECVLQPKIVRDKKTAPDEEETTRRSVVTPSPEKKWKKSSVARLTRLSRRMTFGRSPVPIIRTRSSGSTFVDC